MADIRWYEVLIYLANFTIFYYHGFFFFFCFILAASITFHINIMPDHDTYESAVENHSNS